MNPIAEACTVAEMLAAYRARMAQLQVTATEVGRSLDMADGQMAKIFSTNPHRRSSGRSMGPLSFQLLNTQLGVKWIMVPDPTTEKHASRIRKANSAGMLSIGRQEPVIIKTTLKRLRKLASLGGKARARNLSPSRLSAIGKRGARARWQKANAAKIPWNEIKAVVAKTPSPSPKVAQGGRP